MPPGVEVEVLEALKERLLARRRVAHALELLGREGRVLEELDRVLAGIDAALDNAKQGLVGAGMGL